ncbi:MAG: peptidoglycan DD-metalloendopeptidase family protein, partial [Candidatus Omnitrophica bacterium]|nr:peptidoglycan DD-metalloendopeptidase family protein [Candidatus Omnitrophota bacterium]
TGCAKTEYKPMPQPPAQPQTPGPVQKEGTFHKVVRGQTLWQIAQAYGVPLKDIIESNHIPNGTTIEVGQLLFIPGIKKAQDITTHVVDNNKNEFIWPLKGKILVYFDDPIGYGVLSHGIDIQAQAGDAVEAVRAGDVVLADYITGYGKTVMIDHKDGFISVYAHNSRLLVALGAHVIKGEAVAEVGPIGKRVVEHFEIRRGSQATNPLYYLP